MVYCDETLLAGEEVKAYISYSETDERKNWSMSLYSVTGQEEWPGTISIDINREGFIAIYLLNALRSINYQNSTLAGRK